MSFDLSQITRETGIRHVEFHDQLESTSSLAGQLLPDLLPLAPALVLAAEQTSGRGRGNNEWWASRGALTFTLVLDAKDLPVAPEQRPMISLAAGIAVHSVISQLVQDRDVKLKWPNDVLIGEQKNCGILTELKYHEQQAAILIGIGVNINNSIAAAPTEVSTRAVSCFDLTGQTFDLTQILIDILHALEARIGQLARAPETLCSDINGHHLLNGRNVEISSGNEIQRGICLGVKFSGALELQIGAERRSFVAGTILNWGADS